MTESIVAATAAVYTDKRRRLEHAKDALLELRTHIVAADFSTRFASSKLTGLCAYVCDRAIALMDADVELAAFGDA